LSVLLFALFDLSLAQSSPCTGTDPQIPPHAVELPPNTQIAVIVAPNSNQTITAALAQSMQDLNNQSTANGTGTTFQTYNTLQDAINANVNFGAVVNLTFDVGPNANTNPTNPVSGEQVVALNTPISGGANITEYLGSKQCTPQGGLCFDPLQNGYQQAMTTVLDHEFYEGLGVGDVPFGPNSSQTPGASLMNSYIGVNNSSGNMAAGPTCWDNAAVIKYMNVPPSPPPPPPGGAVLGGGGGDSGGGSSGGGGGGYYGGQLVYLVNWTVVTSTITDQYGNALSQCKSVTYYYSDGSILGPYNSFESVWSVLGCFWLV
jgi:hypothetical protein